ncbi:MAG: hypothetical protein GY833_27130, partial [Aestuariibacter sp.]|nr:hypothetical protein [Aestuariibacter sp.]
MPQYRSFLADLECYNCHQKGHISRNCRQSHARCQNFSVDLVSQTAPAATTGQQASVAGMQTAAGSVPPTANVAVLNVQQGGPVNSCLLCLKTTHLVIDCPTINSQLTGHVDVIEHPESVPGMVPSMIQESASIEGMLVKATMDCAAAASVCDRETAYQVFKHGKAVFCSGAQKLLSLHAFGGINIKLYDTYFATRVKACDTGFNQIFFIVNNQMHPVLLGLPALISAKCQLL